MTAASAETLILDGAQMPSGMYDASDPCLLNIVGTWCCLFTTVTRPGDGKKYSIEQACMALAAGYSLGDPVSNWKIVTDSAGGFARFINLGTPGSWDEAAIESPTFVAGYDPVEKRQVARIYYTGWKYVQTSTDAAGGPVYGYKEWKIGMAEWVPAANQWVKVPHPVVDPLLDGADWETMHFINPDGSRTAYGEIGDQSVIYAAGNWHLYYQAVTDSPTLRVVTVHAVSRDGVTWPAAQRKILNTRPPSPSAIMPNGPYSLNVSVINRKYYFVGWLPNADVSKQGLWMASSSTPDGSAPGDFRNWIPLLYDNNGVWWHTGDAASLAAHEAGLFAPVLVLENGLLWMYYSGNRQDAPSNLIVSLGRAQVDPKVLMQ